MSVLDKFFFEDFKKDRLSLAQYFCMGNFYFVNTVYLGFEYILKIQQGEVNKLEFSKFSNLILRFFVRERIKLT